MGFVRTVTGDVDPGTLGFTLPHEHTQCHLWRIPERFDYWELTADEDLIAAELERFRAAGGTCLADVTLGGIGRDPAWLRRGATHGCAPRPRGDQRGCVLPDSTPRR
jgi:predicted metal-dependent phosphotriesterase family hydrolase